MTIEVVRKTDQVIVTNIDIDDDGYCHISFKDNEGGTRCLTADDVSDLIRVLQAVLADAGLSE